MQHPYLTPPEVAQVVRVDVHRVLGWIHAGELAATNIGERGSSRPRYRVALEELQRFLRARQVQVPPRVRRQRDTEPRVYFSRGRMVGATTEGNGR